MLLIRFNNIRRNFAVENAIVLLMAVIPLHNCAVLRCDSKNRDPCTNFPGLCTEGGGLCVVKGPCEYECVCPPDGRKGRDCSKNEPAQNLPKNSDPTSKSGSSNVESLLVFPKDLFWDLNHVAEPIEIMKITSPIPTVEDIQNSNGTGNLRNMDEKDIVKSLTKAVISRTARTARIADDKESDVRHSGNLKTTTQMPMIRENVKTMNNEKTSTMSIKEHTYTTSLTTQSPGKGATLFPLIKVVITENNDNPNEEIENIDSGGNQSNDTAVGDNVTLLQEVMPHESLKNQSEKIDYETVKTTENDEIIAKAPDIPTTKTPDSNETAHIVSNRRNNNVDNLLAIRTTTDASVITINESENSSNSLLDIFLPQNLSFPQNNDGLANQTVRTSYGDKQEFNHSSHDSYPTFFNEQLFQDTPAEENKKSNALLKFVVQRVYHTPEKFIMFRRKDD